MLLLLIRAIVAQLNAIVITPTNIALLQSAIGLLLRNVGVLLSAIDLLLRNIGV